MNTGFIMLQEGKFAEAQDFFNGVLEVLPNSKTANICLGRAVGLAGIAPKTLEIFLKTDKIYPNDFELKLNIGEAYL